MTEHVDTLGLLAATRALPEQLETALEIASTVDGLPDAADVSNVLVLGVGTGGAVGDLLTVTAGPFMPVPVVVVKNYEPPSYVDESTLVFAISFSGNGEETVQAATTAAAAGARVVAVTAGGELARLAGEWGAPVVPVDPTIPAARAALGALAVPPLVVLERMGLFPGAVEWTRRAVQQLQRRRASFEADADLPADLAHRIGRTIPIVYGAGGIGGVAARRWKTQCNDNPKIPAFSAALPELCHNELAGWGQHGDLTRQVFTLVALRHEHEHPQQSRAFEAVLEMTDEVVADVLTVEAQGDGSIAQLLDLTYIGDLCSVHLALKEGVDPGPVPAIDEIQARLRGG